MGIALGVVIETSGLAIVVEAEQLVDRRLRGRERVAHRREHAVFVQEAVVGPRGQREKPTVLPQSLIAVTCVCWEAVKFSFVKVLAL